MLHSKSKEKTLVLFGNPVKKLKQLGNRAKTGPSVPVSGTLRFGGAGPVGPLREMTKKRPADEDRHTDIFTNTCSAMPYT